MLQEIIKDILGGIVGSIVVLIIYLVRMKCVGTLHIDTTDEAKDVFRFEFTTPPEDIKSKKVMLKIDRK